MKHTLLCILLLISLSVSAQINKNQIIWTANLNSQLAQHSRINGRDPSYNIGINAEASFLIRNGLALGLSAQGAWGSYRSIFTDLEGIKIESRNRSGSLMPFVRKYWEIAPFILYVGGGVNVSYTKSSGIHQVPNQIDQQQRFYENHVVPQTQLGVIYPITDRLGLNVAAESALFPISFNSVKIGLVVLSGAKTTVTNTTLTDSEHPLSKGRWLLSGTFNSDLETRYVYENDFRESSKSIELGAGFFVRDRLLVGTTIYLALENAVFRDTKTAGFVSDGNTTPIRVGIRPYVKKYLTNTRLTPYIQGYLSYERIMAGGPATNTVYGGGDFGLAYVFGKHWLMEGRLLGLSAGYSKVMNLETDIGTISGRERITADLNAGFQPAFTVAYVFK